MQEFGCDYVSHLDSRSLQMEAGQDAGKWTRAP
jgi:hypothetical protein